MAKRKVVKLIVTVELDPIPGTMHTEESALQAVQFFLDYGLKAYNPRVYETLPEHKNPC